MRSHLNYLKEGWVEEVHEKFAQRDVSIENDDEWVEIKMKNKHLMEWVIE